MGIFPETPSQPGSEQMNEQGLTVATLAGELADFAERDEKFENLSRPKTGLETYWEDENYTAWRVGFTAVHCHGKEGYEGQAYNLRLTIVHEIVGRCAELVRVAEKENQRLPDPEHHYSTEVTYDAEYTISQYGTLGWSIHRYYELLHDQDDIEPLTEDHFEDHSSDDDDDEGEDGDEDSETVLSKSMQLVAHISHRTPPKVPTELQRGEQVENDDEWMTCIETEIYVRLAQAVYEMLASGDEGKFDLATVFPEEVLTQIG